MRPLLTLAVVALLVAGGRGTPVAAEDAPTPAVTVPAYVNPTCPIMGKPASRALFAETPTHGRIYVCCPPCIVKINRDPEKAYAAAFPVTKRAGNATCPVSDAPLGADAVTVVLQGYEVRVCATCAAQAQQDSQIVLAKALDSRLTELRNRTCPVNGAPVATNAFCVIGTELVHLSSPRAVEDVRKDPTRYLTAAREIVARQAPPAPRPGGAPGAAR